MTLRGLGGDTLSPLASEDEEMSVFEGFTPVKTEGMEEEPEDERGGGISWDCEEDNEPVDMLLFLRLGGVV